MYAQLLRAPTEPELEPTPARASWLQLLRVEIDTHLVEFFEAKKEETRRMSPPTIELVDAIEALTMRGGKRLRPAVAAAGYRCIRPGQGMDRLVELGASLELLQSYLLIHDDWMDGDEVRRGGPAVHTVLQRSHGDSHLGSALGVLAGDLASAYAWELFLASPFPTQAWARATTSFVDIHKEVYCGQQLDLTGDDDVARMHALKTTSYSVRGPLLLGRTVGKSIAGSARRLVGLGRPDRGGIPNSRRPAGSARNGRRHRKARHGHSARQGEQRALRAPSSRPSRESGHPSKRSSDATM